MGCRVKTNQHGTLALSVHWNGRRFWEGTGLPDTARNRGELARLANLISAEIRANRFTADRYLHYFPNGNHSHEFQPAEPAPAVLDHALTVNEYYQLWIKRQQPPFVRAALARDYRQNITRSVLPVGIDTATGRPKPLGELLVSEITAPILLQLREKLSGRGLALKTVRNIMDASFRAMLRDARAVDQLIDRDPFAGLIWPRMPKRPADPFTEDERDKLVRWFRTKQPFYYPFVLFLFYTGTRPSEAVALRWGDVDAEQGVVSIRLSRYLGSEGATKTQHSERTIRLLPEVRDALRQLRPLHATEDSYVFVNSKNGGPIEQREWPRDHWRRALTGTKIRPRKFYATKHTFISVALTKGLNLKFIAEYCGTSVAMIEQHYGRFLASRVDDQLALLSGSTVAREEAKTATFGGGLQFRAEKPLRNIASPTGFEPVAVFGKCWISKGSMWLDVSQSGARWPPVAKRIAAISGACPGGRWPQAPSRRAKQRLLRAQACALQAVACGLYRMPGYGNG